MESILHRDMSETNNSSIMNGDEILDILLDDPILKDFNGLIDEGLLAGIDQLETFPQCYENESTPDFWNSFLKDIEKEKLSVTEIPSSCDNPDTDSTSHFSDSASPQSVSSASDNMEASILIQPYISNFKKQSDHDLYSVPQVYCDNSITGTHQTTIDIGADVIVETSEHSQLDDSNHSTIITLPIQQITKSSTKSGRKRKCEDDDDDLSLFSTIPDLHLTEDEVKLIKKEGLHIPTHLPLTKAEEKELKRIRRKIRNKHSAQESRKRKKEYVDGLENRVKICTSENMRLQKKVQVLENQQKGLLEQIKHLQSVIAGSSTKQVPTSTCFMILLASFFLFLLPSLFPTSNYEPKGLVSNGKAGDTAPVAGRVLLAAKEVDSGQIDKGISEEIINKSLEQYPVTVKSEFLEEPYQKPFDSYPSSMVELSSHQYNPAIVTDLVNHQHKTPQAFTWNPPGYQKDEAGFIVQNESRFFDAADSPHINRKVLLR